MDWAARAVSLLICLAVLLATIHTGDAERKIVCYYTNWSIYRPGTAKFSPQNINPYLCTHLIYAFGGFTKDNALKPFDKYQDIEKGGYAKFTGLKTYNKNLKTLLAIGGWNEGSSRFSPMVADPDRRRELVKNTVKFLRKNHFDGLDLDWEYPAFRDGGKPRDKENYANLVQELMEEFERESSKTGRPRLLLSMAMPAGIEYIDKGYDVPRLNEYLDFINLLSYDYHSSFEPAVNHHSPLHPLEEDNEYNYDSELTIDYTVNYLLKKGASPEKIILGIPTYGRSYTLFNQDATELGSPADGPGVEGDATREKGYLAYYEICENLAQSDDWEVVQPNSNAMGPYAFKGDQWVGFDDEDIVRLKAKYANEKNLGGIMFWTIDNDDFRGKCHGRPYPLIEAAKEALLTDSTNTVQKTKTVESRKRTRTEGVQSNSIGRKPGSGARRSTTTAAPVTKRVTSSRPKYRTFSRNKSQDEEEEEDQEIDRRSYDRSSEEEGNSERGNAVKNGRTKSRSTSTRNRRKQSRRKENKKSGNDSGESLSNKLTTPEPPTTPDPGTDFKCEDEGFFPHPRDCKKYFWCLESGPGGLGVVAHQFTCPSGLVFNKAADSCDYPRNVVCPKKTSESSSSTTRAPITAATSRTTYLYSTTRRPTTEKPEDEEYEYYDDEDEEEEEEEVVEEEKKPPKATTTPKPLLYKTINRSRSTTTSTTEISVVKTEKNQSDKVDEEDEEDPKVIKELIKLIKKAGGIEELEKQLLQGKTPEDATNPGIDSATPATISRTLYERVLSRQAGKIGTRQRSSANGPGGSQFEGLDEVPEVKSLRRSHKPQYVTIERSKPSSQTPVEDEEDEEEENEDDTEDVASSEERSSSFVASSTQRVTPNYINIRRPRPSTTTTRSENDVEEKNKNAEEDPVRQRRPNLSSKSENGNDEANVNQENSSTSKSRYVSVQRFRSTTPQAPEATSEIASSTQEPVTEPVVSSEEPRVVSSTPRDEETERSVSNETSTESVKLVDDSATEILLTTAPASLSTSSSTRITGATVSQPRPFGFNRRNRPSSTEQATTPLPKVASSPPNRLPTLKELIGYRRDDDPVLVDLLPPSIDQETRANLLLDEKNEGESLNENGAREEPPRADSYYIEENLADDDEDASFASKRRFDRQDSSVELKPTTMRGVPLLDLIRDQAPRGFYVTRSDPEPRNTERVENESTTDVETTSVTPNTDSSTDLDGSETVTASTKSETTSVEYDTSTVATVTELEEQTTLTTLPSTTVAEKRNNRRREKIDSDFGQRSSTRVRQRVKDREENPRRRIVYRGRQRTPAVNNSNVNTTNREEKEQVEETATLSSKEKVTGNEVNSSTNTPAQSPGSLLSTRLRKPAAFAPTSQQTKSSNTFTNHRKTQPTGGDHTPDGEKLDAADKTTNAPKVEKDIDQSSRAQEIAVTLAEPPPSQPSTTGRPALRNAFRRKISTTIAPRTDATPTTTTTTATTTTTTTTTKSRSSLRFATVLRDRQRPKAKDKPVESATTRPRRPQVIDYDYYDEEESVVGKSAYNGKLFLTSKGSIRCLDQGNFPHPYSCRKFITCARMVTGLVVGAEYTCPDKLSYDPVGGICNWSAGLGCND